MSGRGASPRVMASVADLDHEDVVEALKRHNCIVSYAAAELGVPASDLRRLTWGNPALQDLALEAVEKRLDKAERIIDQALESEDHRRQDAAAYHVVRNTPAARNRGWATAAALDVNVGLRQPTRIVISWEGEGEGDDEDGKAEADDSAAGPIIEHDPGAT